MIFEETWLILVEEKVIILNKNPEIGKKKLMICVFWPKTKKFKIGFDSQNNDNDVQVDILKSGMCLPCLNVKKSSSTPIER